MLSKAKLKRKIEDLLRQHSLEVLDVRTKTHWVYRCAHTATGRRCSITFSASTGDGLRSWKNMVTQVRRISRQLQIED